MQAALLVPCDIHPQRQFALPSTTMDNSEPVDHCDKCASSDSKKKFLEHVCSVALFSVASNAVTAQHTQREHSTKVHIPRATL